MQKKKNQVGGDGRWIDKIRRRDADAKARQPTKSGRKRARLAMRWQEEEENDKLARSWPMQGPGWLPMKNAPVRRQVTGAGCRGW